MVPDGRTDGRNGRTDGQTDGRTDDAKTISLRLRRGIKTTTTEPPPKTGRQHMPQGKLNAFYWYQIFALSYVGVSNTKHVCSHRSFLTIAIYQHREAIKAN